MSVISELITPPAISFIKSAARFNAQITVFGFTVLSKRNEASVFNACLLAVLRTETGLKKAASKNIDVVVSETPESTPPNTPAIHIGSWSLQIIKSLVFNLRS